MDIKLLYRAIIFVVVLAIFILLISIIMQKTNGFEIISIFKK